MIERILDNQKILKDLYFNKLDKIREEFDFNNQDKYFTQMKKDATILKDEIKKHFLIQERLKSKINPQVTKLVIENTLVREILFHMSDKIIDGANKKDISIFSFFDDFEEILRAYLKKEEGLFIQELKMATSQEEREKIEQILKD